MNDRRFLKVRGQSLVEILVAAAVGVLMTVAAVTIIAPAIRSETSLSRGQTATSLAKELLENVRSLAETDWRAIYDLGKDPSLDHYHIVTSTTPFSVGSGEETVTILDIDYTRYFYVENVSRDNQGFIQGTGGSKDDPSAQKVTIVYGLPNVATKTISQYLIRSGNNSLVQTDWSAGPRVPTEVLVDSNDRFAASSFIRYASTTGSLLVAFGNSGGQSGEIDPVDHWAWNDMVGWMDFYTPGTVTILEQNLTGYASSSFGDISLDCATTRINNICTTSNYKVKNNGAGSLSGWGWNDEIGWISFCGGGGADPDCPGAVTYGVTITSGDFSQWAWNDIAGWISFNCVNHGCGLASYKVKTAWSAVASTGTLDSAIFDTGSSGGSQINSIIWKGDLPVGTSVYFQLAASNATSGPWAFQGPTGPLSYYIPSVSAYTPGTFIVPTIDYILYNNQRYFRYRIFLQSDSSQTLSPRVDDIIVNWSP